jgi:hypothetical protein
MALHALLVAAAAWVGVSVWLEAAAAAAAALHCLARWPRPAPSPLLVAEDGAFHVPALAPGWLAPGPRSRLAALWLRLSLEGPAGSHDILLCIDQVDAASWSRVNARLRRRRNAGTTAAPCAQSTRQVDLR